MGNTFSLRGGSEYAMEGVFGDGWRTAVRGSPASRWRNFAESYGSPVRPATTSLNATRNVACKGWPTEAAARITTRTSCLSRWRTTPWTWSVSTPPGVRERFASARPNELWCTDYKGEFLLGNRQYCYPLTVTRSCQPLSPHLWGSFFYPRRVRFHCVWAAF